MRRTMRDALRSDTAAPVVLSAGVVAVLVCSGATQTAPGELIAPDRVIIYMPTPSKPRSSSRPVSKKTPRGPAARLWLPIRYRRAHPPYARNNQFLVNQCPNWRCLHG